MKLWDITRELTSAPVYPGDPAPRLTRIQQMELGDICNLTSLSLCAHNATHLDAPLHFIPEGEDISQVPLEACCGPCRVAEWEGPLLGDAAERLTERYPGVKRWLFKGDMTVDISAAYVLADAGPVLIGVEAQSVSSPDQTERVHRHLLGSGVLLLEGLDLSAVSPGEYTLYAAPMKIAGCEGAPVRAFLTDDRDSLDVPDFFKK